MVATLPGAFGSPDASPLIVVRPQAISALIPAIRTTVTPSVQTVDRSVRNLIHSDATTRGNVTPLPAGRRVTGAAARDRVAAVIGVHLRSAALLRREWWTLRAPGPGARWSGTRRRRP